MEGSRHKEAQSVSGFYTKPSTGIAQSIQKVFSCWVVVRKPSGSIPDKIVRKAMDVIPEDRQALLRVARWTLTHKHFRVAQIRQLAGTEENYRIIIKEIDRVKAQLQHARSLSAEATLTLLDWLMILDRFHWQCAYCQAKPFEILSHIIPLPVGGTTPENCVPACYGCRASRKTGNNEQLQPSLAAWRHEETAD